MQYSGINAKIKSMKGKLLERKNMEELSRSVEVSDVGVKLKEYKTYSKALATLEGKDLVRIKIEPKLMLSLMDDFSRVYKFISDFSLREYANTFILKREIYMLKQLLSVVNDERHIRYTQPELNVLLGRRLKIDIPKLRAAKSIGEFIETLKGTQFFNLLNTAHEHQATLFDLESKLDIYYHMELWKSQNKNLKGNNLKVMERINGTEIDLKNLMWLYRLKTYYQMEEAQIYTHLIPIQYRLSSSQITKIVQTKTQEELIAEIMSTAYGEMLLKNNNIEDNFYSIMRSLYHKLETRYPNTLATTTSYMFLKNLEIANIISLLECVKYQLKPEETMKHIV